MWKFQQTVSGISITQRKDCSFPFCSLSICPSECHITLSVSSLALWQVKKSSGLPRRATTNSCQERNNCFKHILEKGRDDKVKLHGLSCYCGYSVYPIWLKMFLWLILGRQAINRVIASGCPPLHREGSLQELILHSVCPSTDTPFFPVKSHLP